MAASVRAVARSGEEDASSNGLTIDIRYTDADGNAVNVARVPQGMDLIAQVSVRNTSRRQLDNLALTQMFPGGWEIRNDRLENVDTSGERATDQDKRSPFWWVPAEWRARQRREAEYTDIRDDRVAALLQPAPRMNRSSSRRGSTPPTWAGSIYRAADWKPCTTPRNARQARTVGGSGVAPEIDHGALEPQRHRGRRGAWRPPLAPGVEAASSHRRRFCRRGTGAGPALLADVAAPAFRVTAVLCGRGA